MPTIHGISTWFFLSFFLSFLSFCSSVRSHSRPLSPLYLPLYCSRLMNSTRSARRRLFILQTVEALGGSSLTGYSLLLKHHTAKAQSPSPGHRLLEGECPHKHGCQSSVPAPASPSVVTWWTVRQAWGLFRASGEGYPTQIWHGPGSELASVWVQLVSLQQE